MANVPFSTVIVLNSTPVAFCFAVTSVPGITAPEESTTTPERDDVAATCPNAGRHTNSANRTASFFTTPSIIYSLLFKEGRQSRFQFRDTPELSIRGGAAQGKSLW